MPNIRVRNQYAPGVQSPFTPQPTIPSDIGNAFFSSLRELGGSISALGGAIEAQKQKESDFIGKKAYLDEATRAQFDLQKAMVNAPLGAPNFSQEQLLEFQERHNQVLDNLREQGLSEDQLNDLDLKFSTLRSTIVGRSLTFELGSRTAKVAADFESTGANVAQALLLNPEQLPDALVGLEDAAASLPIPAEDRQVLYEQQAAKVRYAAGLGLARVNPQLVVNLFTPARAADEQSFISAMSAGITEVESGGNYNAHGPWVNTKSGRSRAYGKYQVMGYNVGPWTEKAFGQRLTTAQFLASPEAQEAVFADQMATLYKKYNGSVRDAASVWFTGRTYDRAVRAGAKDVNISVQEYVRRVEKALGQQAGPIMAQSGDVGNAVLDALTADERIRVLNAANTELGRRGSDAKAQLEIDVANASSSVLAGEPYTGRLPSQEDFYNVYGPLEGEQQFAEFEGTLRTGEAVQKFGTLNETEIAAEVNRLRPQDTGSDTYAVDLDTYNNTAAAAQLAIKQRSEDSVGYAVQHYPSVKGAYEAVVSNPQDATANRAYYTQLRAAFEDLGLPKSDWKVFQPGMLTRHAEYWAELTPTERVGKLGEMYSQMGELFPSAMNQLYKDGYESEAYIAEQIAADPELQSTYVRALVGLSKAEADNGLAPSTDKVDKAFTSLLGRATIANMPPGVATAIKDLSKGLFVDLNGDPEQVEGSAEFDAAARRVLGGTGDDDSGFIPAGRGLAQFSEKLPNLTPGPVWGQFRRELEIDDIIRLSDGGVPSYAGGEQATADDIQSEGVLVWAGGDDYQIFMSSDGAILQDGEGQPLWIHLTRQDVVEIAAQGSAIPEPISRRAEPADVQQPPPEFVPRQTPSRREFRSQGSNDAIRSQLNAAYPEAGSFNEALDQFKKDLRTSGVSGREFNNRVRIFTSTYRDAF